ncbi:heavy metal translocating P-type ATPase [Halobacteriaceae archaeon SHR40]|uniref:heavy metal translocating P-type ATPase n=1 Tax=Halovenus amylolytica TaxID=2500550 RepID=UPI000FE3868F
MESEPLCSLCGCSLKTSAVVDEQGDSYCSDGCRSVATTLDVADTEASSETTSSNQSAQATFLHIDGMHCHTCEQFLERIATAEEGVSGAEASYITETIRIESDPDEISVEELCESLSTVGYSAVPRETLSTVADDQNRRTDERHMDDMIGFRYAAGVLVGMFILMPYILVFYPSQIPGFLDAMTLFESGPGPGDGIFILPAFLGMTSIVLFFTGLPVLRGAYVSLRMRQPNTDLLVTITIVSAYVYGTLAFLTGNVEVYYDLTIVISATVVAAIYYESLVKQRAVDRLTELTVSEVTHAERYDEDGTTSEVAVEELQAGDSVLVTQGDRIPVDGSLENGGCTVDEAVVTGESLPVRKEAGDSLIGGSIVVEDRAVLEVGDPPTSSLDGLTTAVWDLQSASHGVQRRSDRLAALVVPALAVLAVVVTLSTVAVGGSILGGIFAGLATLLVTCPWAVGLSTPLSVATSIEAGLRRGIIIFDETIFERLRETDTVVFDKTGTLTTGEMQLLDADAPTELLSAVAVLEKYAAHPASTVIEDEFGRRADGGRRSVETASEPERVEPQITDVKTHATGIEGKDGDRTLLVGNLDLFADQGWTVQSEIEQRALEEREAGNLPVIVGDNGSAEGLVVLGDSPRREWAETISRLADRDIEIVVLTGDDGAAAAQFEAHEDVDHVFAGVSPDGKTEAIRRLRARGHVTMVGDGTNDGPALAGADLGISISTGTALAAEAADITILDENISTVETAFDLADAARRRLYQNTGLALSFNGFAIGLAVAGVLNPLFVMGAAVVSGGTIALNSTRSLL